MNPKTLRAAREACCCGPAVGSAGLGLGHQSLTASSGDFLFRVDAEETHYRKQITTETSTYSTNYDSGWSGYGFSSGIRTRQRHIVSATKVQRTTVERTRSQDADPREYYHDSAEDIERTGSALTYEIYHEEEWQDPLTYGTSMTTNEITTVSADYNPATDTWEGTVRKQKFYQAYTSSVGGPAITPPPNTDITEDWSSSGMLPSATVTSVVTYEDEIDIVALAEDRVGYALAFMRAGDELPEIPGFGGSPSAWDSGYGGMVGRLAVYGTGSDHAWELSTLTVVDLILLADLSAWKANKLIADVKFSLTGEYGGEPVSAYELIGVTWAATGSPPHPSLVIFGRLGHESVSTTEIFYEYSFVSGHDPSYADDGTAIRWRVGPGYGWDISPSTASHTRF